MQSQPVHAPLGALGFKMGVEERGDAAAGVERGRLVVGDVREAQHLEEDALVVVHERMSGVWVFLHIVGDEGAFERALKLDGDALIPTVLGTVAGYDGAGCGEEGFELAGSCPP